MTFIMTPDMANFSGHVHGGTILKLLDQVAYAYAARYYKNYGVTASLDQVIFKQPIRVGELVTVKANVNYVGRTSMEVGIKVIAENLTSQERVIPTPATSPRSRERRTAALALYPRSKSSPKPSGGYLKQARCAWRCARKSCGETRHSMLVCLSEAIGVPPA